MKSLAMLILPLSLILTTASLRAQQPRHFGFEYETLGQATATVVGEDLVIGNIGASGADGVAFDVGGGHAAAVKLDAFPATAPPGAIRVTSWSWGETSTYSLCETKAAIGTLYAADFGGGTSMPRDLFAFHQGALVAVVRGYTGSWDWQLLGDAGRSRIEGLAFGDGPGSTETPIDYGDFSGTSVMYLDVTETAFLPDGRWVAADELIVKPSVPQRAGTIDIVTLGGNDLGAIVVQGASRALGEIPVRLLGNAVLEPTTIGGESMDVLRAEPGPAPLMGGAGNDLLLGGRGNDIILMETEIGFTSAPAAPPAGSHVEIRYDLGHGDAMRTRLDSDGDEVALSVAWPAGASSPTRVEALLGGVVVGSGTATDLMVPSFPTSTSMHFYGASFTGGVTVAGSLDFPAQLDLSAADLGTVMADEVRFSVDFVAGLLRPIVGQSLEAAGLEVVVAATTTETAPAVEPFPGTGEDFTMRTTDVALGFPTAAQRKDVRATQPLVLVFQSHFGTFDLAPLFVPIQLLGPAETPSSPFPGVQVDPAGTIGLLVGDASAPLGPLLLTPGGSVFTIVPPAALIGHRLMAQGIIPTAAAANGIFASTDGHELTVIP